MEITYARISYFTNVIEYEMTEKETLESGHYEKIFKENGVIKKIESYLNQNIPDITYYLDEGENEKDIFKELIQQFGSVVFKERKFPMGDLFIERERDTYIFENETMIKYSIRVYDKQDRLVCFQITDKNYTPIISTEEMDLVKYCYISIPREQNNPELTDYFLKFIYQDQEGLEVEYGKPLNIEWHMGNKIFDETSFIENINDINGVISELGESVDYSYYEHPYWMPN
ncbi:hypothetical protein [Aureivirga sp. CE67]|uniref:hypothetical protein n=1 Tax=Aureivirga sp. CE67 TaxID=1788983 RepID=UPI0018CB4D54|nr:hypothetical protein [Aureivirga sp. CE67]